MPRGEKLSDLREELERVQARLAELEATTQAIRNGEVDAIVVDGPDGSRIFTLQSPEDPYRILAERMNEGAATLTADGTVLFCNRRLAEMAMLPAERLLGSSFSAMLCVKDRQGLSALLETALLGDVRAEHQLLQSDGSCLPVQLSLSPISSAGSEQVICMVATDLSELKRARQGLREQAEVFELAHDAIIMCSLDHRILSWNRGAQDLYGWSAEEAVGQDLQFLLQTRFPLSHTQVQSVVFASREWEGELRQASRDGKTVIVASRWSLLRDEAGNSSAILEINRDITERKRIETALQEREAEFRALAEITPQLVWACTPDGLNIYFNQRWVDYTGLSLVESYGRGWNTPFHPDDKQPAWNAWNHAVSTGDDYRIECRLRAANGGYRWFLIRGVPFRDASGGIAKWFGTCTDVDDLKRSESKLEDQVERRTAELVAVNQELESFNYAVAHDLRAPLRHIHGFADILAEEAGPVLSEEALRHLDMIQKGAQQMAQLLEDLLSLSRLGRQEIHTQVCSLNVMIDDTVRSLRPEINDRTVQWQIASLPSLECDSSLMKQVFFNLLANALKYSRPRDPAIIEIGQMFIAGEPVIFIRDNGVGFDMKYASKLFGVFQRLHRQEDFEGTGVGLAIVQRIMYRHGGRVWAEATLDRGATFYLAFPADRINQQELVAPGGMNAEPDME